MLARQTECWPHTLDVVRRQPRQKPCLSYPSRAWRRESQSKGIVLMTPLSSCLSLPVCPQIWLVARRGRLTTRTPHCSRTSAPPPVQHLTQQPHHISLRPALTRQFTVPLCRSHHIHQRTLPRLFPRYCRTHNCHSMVFLESMAGVSPQERFTELVARIGFSPGGS